ncbi:hypothetical protein TNCV_301041 [Trichonephila clavipes]|nr:hypothetical protein TNCV_301041 [Trichonephila clavipes]
MEKPEHDVKSQSHSSSMRTSIILLKNCPWKTLWGLTETRESPGWRKLVENPEKETWTVDDRYGSRNIRETMNAGGVGELESMI